MPAESVRGPAKRKFSMFHVLSIGTKFVKIGDTLLLQRTPQSPEFVQCLASLLRGIYWGRDGSHHAATNIHCIVGLLAPYSLNIFSANEAATSFKPEYRNQQEITIRLYSMLLLCANSTRLLLTPPSPYTSQDYSSAPEYRGLYVKLKLKLVFIVFDGFSNAIYIL